jgi:lantibiotic biosynthesis protein
VRWPLRQFCNTLPRIISWYFLRYADPRPHLRVRFHNDAGPCGADMVTAVSRWATELMVQEKCESFSFDTYDREIERYGGLSVISAVESAFCTDSMFAAELLACRPTLDPIVLGVFILDRLLEFLELTEERRTSWIRRCVDLTAKDGVIYRQKRNELVEALTSPPAGFLLEVARIAGACQKTASQCVGGDCTGRSGR